MPHGFIRRIGGRFGRADRDDPSGEAAVAELRTRVDLLEAQLEGLQDAIHRESMRQNERIAELARALEPGELSRTLNEYARRHGVA